MTRSLARTALAVQSMVTLLRMVFTSSWAMALRVGSPKTLTALSLISSAS